MNIHSEEASVIVPVPHDPPDLALAPATPASAKPGSKRADILEAALALFVERGFHGTAVPALAQKAKVGAGTIYRYFENKEALVNELYRHWKSAIAEHVTAGMSAGLTPRELFGRFWTRTIEFARSHPRAFAFLELHHHSSYLDAASLEVEANVMGLAKSIIDTMKSQGALKELPASLLMSLIYGALVGFVRGAWEEQYALTEASCADAEACVWESICR